MVAPIRSDDAWLAGTTALVGGIGPPGLPGLQVPAGCGAGNDGGSRNVGGAFKSIVSSRLSALASRYVSAPRFHFVSMNFKIAVWSRTTRRHVVLFAIRRDHHRRNAESVGVVAVTAGRGRVGAGLDVVGLESPWVARTWS